MDKLSPLWPNPAPRGPIHKILRHEPWQGTGATLFRVDRANHAITVLDGESLESIMNRVYALAQIDLLNSHGDLAVELAADALKELAKEQEELLLGDTPRCSSMLQGQQCIKQVAHPGNHESELLSW